MKAMKAMKANIARKATVHKARPKKKVEKKAPTSMKSTEEETVKTMKAKRVALKTSTSATPGMTEVKATTGMPAMKSMHATTTSTSAAGRKDVHAHAEVAPTTSLSPNSEQLVTKLNIDSLRQDRQIRNLIVQVKEHGRLIQNIITGVVSARLHTAESAESACDD